MSEAAAEEHPSFFRKILRNQVVRFFLSAGFGVLVDAVIYFLLYNYVFQKYNITVWGYRIKGVTAAFVISFSAQVITNFLVNKYLVFTESELKGRKQFFRFALVATLGFFANLLLLNLLVELGLYAPYARVLAALSLGAASYFVHKFFSFRIKKSSE
ncbi:MAG: GtrA family protein [Mucilaginibacter polytrichastri]|nr:GtrA family protein [Mucilaginibacter polytrichastri]